MAVSRGDNIRVSTNQQTTMSTAKDLSKEAPASPRIRTGGYAVLARLADKGRSEIAGTTGDFHFDCPLDNYLFGFKGVQGADVKKVLESGASNEELAAWLDANGEPKTAEEKQAWSDGMEAARPYDNPEKKDWFAGVCAEAGCDPAASTLFDYLEADDKTTFAK
jgi:Domain of unknown function (DUF5069)